jgi:hypothetical protein
MMTLPDPHYRYPHHVLILLHDGDNYNGDRVMSSLLLAVVGNKWVNEHKIVIFHGDSWGMQPQESTGITNNEGVWI